MKIKDIVASLNNFAPLHYQESYDNSGYQVGNPDSEVKSALLTLDVTESTIEEAISLECNLVIAHHPLLFKPLKSLTGKNATERIVIKAIQNDITIYAAHTNLDNMQEGVNQKISEKLGLKNVKILSPLSHNILKLHTYVPEKDADVLLEGLFTAGAGDIGKYYECSYQSNGQGTFRPGEESNPTIGESGGKRESVKEQRIEVIFPEERKDKILQALFKYHPYEEVAYGILRLENEDQTKGAGMVGDLSQAIKAEDFFNLLKNNMEATVIRHTRLHQKTIQKIAFCGGSGSFLLQNAIDIGADVFLTADFKYHQFFEAENKIIIADIGHYEMEQYTVEIFSEVLRKNFPNFATYLTKVNTNPIKYYF